jgi:hypothetical protein
MDGVLEGFVNILKSLNSDDANSRERKRKEEEGTSSCYSTGRTMVSSEFSKSRAVCGIGATIERKGRHLVIAEVLDGGPAAKSGRIHVNDIIVQVDYADVTDMSIIDAARRIVGFAGDPITLTLQVRRKSSAHIHPWAPTLQNHDSVMASLRAQNDLFERHVTVVRWPISSPIIAPMYQASLLHTAFSSTSATCARASQEHGYAHGAVGTRQGPADTNTGSTSTHLLTYFPSPSSDDTRSRVEGLASEPRHDTHVETLRALEHKMVSASCRELLLLLLLAPTRL